MSLHERIVLRVTREAKSRRALRTNIPGERQITTREWETAKRSLVDKNLLTEAGVITQAGREAVDRCPS